MQVVELRGQVSRQVRQRIGPRGDITLGTIAGAIIALVVGIFAGRALMAQLAINQNLGVAVTASTGLDDMRTRVESQTDNAQAVFIPVFDIFGAKNYTGASKTPPAGGWAAAGPSAGPCTGVVGWACLPGATSYTQVAGTSGAHEFDIQTRDIFGNPSFVAYYFTGSSVDEIPYLVRDSSSFLALCQPNVVCTSAIAPSVFSVPARAFSVAYLNASQIPSIDPLLQGVPIHDVSFPIGFSSDVQSGNRMVIYGIDASSSTDPGAFGEVDQVHIVAGTPAMVGVSTTVTYTPPPPTGISINQNPNPIVLQYPGSGLGLPTSANLEVAVQNYHYDLIYYGDAPNTDINSSGVGATFPLGDGIADATVNNIVVGADGSPKNPVAAGSYPGTWDQLVVTPKGVGSTTFNFKTQGGLKPPDDTVLDTATSGGPITVVVQGNISLLPPSSTVQFGGSATLTATEPGYIGPLTIKNTGAGYCGGGAKDYADSSKTSINATKLNGNGGTFTMTANQIPTSTNSGCMVSVSDSVGSPPATAFIQVVGQLSSYAEIDFGPDPNDSAPCKWSRIYSWKNNDPTTGVMVKDANDATNDTDGAGCTNQSNRPAIGTGVYLIATEPGYSGQANIVDVSCAQYIALPFAPWNISAQSALVTVNQSTNGCKFKVADSLSSVTTNAIVNMPCVVNKDCYLEYKDEWTTYVSCVNKNAGDQCPVDHSADDLYSSNDGGKSWSPYFQILVPAPGKQCVAAADIPNVTIAYTDNAGTITPAVPPIGTTNLPINGNTGDPPAPAPKDCAIGPAST